MENVLTILFIIGGVAISLYMSAKKKEQEKAKRMQQGNPLPPKSIFETIFNDTDWDKEEEGKSQEEIQSLQSYVLQSKEETIKQSKILADKGKNDDSSTLLEEGEPFETRHFNLRDAVLYETILTRKYI